MVCSILSDETAVLEFHTRKQQLDAVMKCIHWLWSVKLVTFSSINLEKEKKKKGAKGILM